MLALNNRKVNLVIISILSFILLSSPLVKRSIINNGALQGEDVYYNLEKIMITKDLIKNYLITGEKFSIKQPDIMRGSFFYITPFYMSIALLGLLVNIPILFKVLPLILGIITLLLLYSLLKGLKFKMKYINLALFILIFSPAFLYTFNILTPATISIPLLLIFFILAHKKRFVSALFILLITALLSFTSSLITLLCFLGVIPYLFEQKNRTEVNEVKGQGKTRNKKRIFSYFGRRIIFIISGIIPLIFLLIVNSKIYHFEFLSRGTLIELIPEIGSLNGISLIVLLIGFLEIDLIKKRTMLKWLPYLFIIPLIYMRSPAIPYLLIAILLPASYGINWLMKREWSLPLLKSISIFLIIIEIIFVGLNSDFRISSLEPNNAEIYVFSLLKSQPGGLVWTSPKYGFWINYFSEKRVFADKYSNTSIIKLNNGNMQSKNLSLILNFINKSDIRYILISPEMKATLWKSEDAGLLFLLKNSNAFNEVYNDNFEIWKVNQTRAREILNNKNKI
ncbi:MAG: hypothetical protein GWP09_02560 [Nitrospiraceae bacterium]|nr:hypothetical protein [Nitrospiraceae bacterium]